MGVFDWFKNGFKKILGWGNVAKQYITKGYNFVRKIPGLGNVVEGLVNTPIPLIGMSANQIAGYADNALNVGNDIQRIIDRPTVPLPPTPADRYKRVPLPPTPAQRHY